MGAKEDKVTKNMRLAIGDDLQLSHTLNKLNQRGRQIDTSLNEMIDLKEKFKHKKTCGIPKKKYLQAYDIQKERIIKFEETLFNQYNGLLKQGRKWLIYYIYIYIYLYHIY